MDEVIRQAIILDLESRTQQDVLDAIEDSDDPEEYDFITTTSKVPKHCYQSISKLLTGQDDSDDLPSLVTRIEGTGNPEQHGIEVAYASEEAGEYSFIQPPDEEPAAEYSLMSILSRIGTQVSTDGTQDQLMRDVDARIRFLIDYKCRQRRANIDPYLDPAGVDNTLNPNLGVVCHWLKYLKPSNVLQRASLYRVEFCTVMTP